jgi:hypothetical protein
MVEKTEVSQVEVRMFSTEKVGCWLYLLGLHGNTSWLKLGYGKARLKASTETSQSPPGTTCCERHIGHSTRSPRPQNLKLHKVTPSIAALQFPIGCISLGHWGCGEQMARCLQGMTTRFAKFSMQMTHTWRRRVSRGSPWETLGPSTSTSHVMISFMIFHDHDDVMIMMM